jgi:hypothetical protein
MAVAENDLDLPFSIICLQMCDVSYLPLVQIPKCVAQVNRLTPDAPWECTWAWQDEDNSNLAFVALHYLSDGKPDQAVLTIRGTDIAVPDLWGVLWQAWEDLDFLVQERVTWASDKYPNASVAQGTMKGANEILNLMSPGQTLEAYLTNLFTDYPDLTLTVTGHSLGGCLTTVVASKLRGKIFPKERFPNAQIQAVTFAAPSAGNQAFANYFQSQFTETQSSTTLYHCYASGLDVAPFSWGNLLGLGAIYVQLVGPSFFTPEAVVGGILGLEAAMAFIEVSYGQPSLAAPPNQALIAPAPDWYAEAFYQHHPATYMQWFGGTNVGLAPPVLISSGKLTPATPPMDVGPLSEVISKLRSDVAAKPTT